MSSHRSIGENYTRDDEDAASNAFQLVTQGLAHLKEVLCQQKQVAKCKVKEALRLQEERAATASREMERKLQEKDDAIRALQQRLEETQEIVTAVEKRRTEDLWLQEERAATGWREMELKLREKDDAIRILQQRLRETQKKLTAMERRTTASEECGGTGGLQRLEGRVEKMEASLHATQRATQKFLPRVETLVRQLEKAQSTRVPLTTAAFTSAASAREAPTPGGATASGGEKPPSSITTTTTTTSSGAGDQGAAADEKERERQRVKRLKQEIKLRMERARTCPSPLQEQMCEAVKEGRLNDVRPLIDSGANVNYTDRDGSTPLHIAAKCADPNVMSFLLRRGADVNAVDAIGYTALHLAAESDRSGRCVDMLLGAGCHPNPWTWCDESPLLIASIKNNKKAVRALTLSA